MIKPLQVLGYTVKSHYTIPAEQGNVLHSTTPTSFLFPQMVQWTDQKPMLQSVWMNLAAYGCRECNYSDQFYKRVLERIWHWSTVCSLNKTMKIASATLYFTVRMTTNLWILSYWAIFYISLLQHFFTTEVNFLFFLPKCICFGL